MAEIGPRSDPESLLAHSAWIHALVRALVLDPSEVDDVVQATWLAAIERPRRRWLDPRAWLGGVARNLARETQRKDARRARREEVAARPEGLPSTEELVEKADLQRQVAKAVLELDEPYRSPLLLRYFAELTAEEIARRQSLPGSTVRNRLKHGLERLRERFDRERGGDRRAWALGLLPLALHRGSAGAARVAPSTASSLSSGGSLMLPKIWIAAAATLAVASGTTAVLLRRGAPQGEALAQELLAAAAEADGRGAPEPALATAAQPGHTQRTAVATADRAPLLRGVLRDPGGRPIEAAEVFIGGWSNPLETDEREVVLQLHDGRVLRGELEEIRALDGEALRREGLMSGCLVSTDASGTFEARLPRAGRAWVQVTRTLGVRPLAGAGAWHSTPAGEVALTAERIPTASLSIRVFDQTTGENLTRFDGRIRQQRRVPDSAEEPFSGEFCARASDAAALVLELEGGPEEYELQLFEPPWAQASEEVLVAAGTHQEVALEVHSGAGVSGVVTDESGAAVEGALVFWGDQVRMRGHDSLAGAFHAHCAPEPVLTDARGQFELRGRAGLVSAWHPDLSPTTVPASEAAWLRLGARGGLRGRAVDAQGRPVAGGRVVLDGERETRTDASGAWSFEHLEAALHGLELPGDRWLVARVPSGDVLTVDVDWIGDATVDILSGGAPFREPFGGVIVGEGRVFLIREFETEQGQLGLWNAIPGRYHLISRSGRIARFDVEGTSASVELGDADLTVRAARGERVYLIPEGGDEALAFWSRRSAIEAPEGGAVAWKPLARGRWQVATEGRGLGTTALVSGPGAEVSIE